MIFVLPAAAVLLVAGVALSGVKKFYFIPNFNNPLVGVRAAVDKKIHIVITGASEQALLSGLLFGGGAGFSREWKNNFRATGTSHLIAVSGMNVAFVIAGVEWCLARLRLYPRQRLHLTLVFILIYVIITGAPASVVRAAIMAGVTQLAPFFGRFSSALHALALAVIVMVLINPVVVTDVGFQLSCLATLGLVSDGLRNNKSKKAPEFFNSFSELISATISAILWTLPVSAVVFGTTSAVALISNILIVPLIPFVTIYGFISVGISSLGINGVHFFVLPLQLLLSGILFIIKSLAGISGSMLSVNATPVIFWLWYGLLALVLVRRLWLHWALVE